MPSMVPRPVNGDVMRFPCDDQSDAKPFAGTIDAVVPAEAVFRDAAVVLNIRTSLEHGSRLEFESNVAQQFHGSTEISARGKDNRSATGGTGRFNRP